MIYIHMHPLLSLRLARRDTMPVQQTAVSTEGPSHDKFVATLKAVRFKCHSGYLNQVDRNLLPGSSTVHLRESEVFSLSSTTTRARRERTVKVLGITPAIRVSIIGAFDEPIPDPAPR